MDSIFVVKVIEDATQETVRRFDARTERIADKIADGLTRQIDHDNFSIVIEQADALVHDVFS